MPSGYYSDSAGAKKGLPVNAHSHALDRTHFSNVGVSNDGSVSDPTEGQGLYWVGNPPDDPNPGKWFAGDAPTKAPVSETVLANWFEPTSWRPPPLRRGTITSLNAADVAARLATVVTGGTHADITYVSPAVAEPAVENDYWYLEVTQEFVVYSPGALGGTTPGGVTFGAGWIHWPVSNVDGAAGTWRPDDPVSTTPGNIFSWRNPGDFGIPSETVNGYIRLQTTSDITIEWGAEVNSGARPIAYGAAGTQSAGEYVYKLTALCMALENKDGAVGPWKLSMGLAFYTDNVARDNDGAAPTPSLTKHIVWGVNEYDLTTTTETDTWTAVECYMNGRVATGDVPSDAPLGGVLDWRDEDADGPDDGYFFAPVIKITGADADVLIDSVQVFRGQNQMLVPGGVITKSVTTDALTIGSRLSASELELTPLIDAEVPRFDKSVITEGDDNGDSTYFTKVYDDATFATPQDPPVVDSGGLLFSWDAAPTQAGTDAKIALNDAKMAVTQPTFRAGNTYRFEMTVTPSSASAAPYYAFVGDIASGQLATPAGTAPEEYVWEWTPAQDYTHGEVVAEVTTDVAIGFGVQQSDELWANAGTHTVNNYQMFEVGDIPGKITGLGDPVDLSDPVTKGWFESQELGGGNSNVVHVPDVTEPEPVEDPEEPFEDGSIWANPGAPLSVPAFWPFIFGDAGGSVQNDSSWSDIPNYDLMEFTAPGPGVLYMNGAVRGQVVDYQMQFRLYVVDQSALYLFRDTSDLQDLDGTTTVFLDTVWHPQLLAAFDSPGTIIVRLQSSITEGFTRGGTVGNAKAWCQWAPGAVMFGETGDYPSGQAGHAFAPFARVRSGNTWTPSSANITPGLAHLDADVTIVNVSTSTSIDGGGTQNGGSRTLTATVSGTGTPVGSVQFKKNGSVFSTKTLSGGQASVSVSTTGSYSASYLGGQSGAYNYQPSSSTSTSVTIRTLTTYSTTKGLKWYGRYPQSNGYVQSDYYSHVMRQGRYSATWGNWKTLWGFDGVGGLSNLYDATKVEILGFDLDHTYYGGGADLDLGWHTHGSRPGTFSDGSGQQNQGGYYRSVGTHTIDISSWAKTRVTRTDFGGIIVGSDSSGNLNHYCYGSSHPSLRITYRRWV